MDVFEVETTGGFREPAEIGSDVWYRFDRYVIRENRIIPAPGATLRYYDPWVQYRESRKSKKEMVAPYQELLDLESLLTFRTSSRLNDRGHSRMALTPEAESALLAWCSRNGLLGMLLDRVRQVTFAPQKRSFNGIEHLEQECFRRTSGWTRHIFQEKGHKFPGVSFDDELAPPTGALLRKDDFGPLNFEPLSKTWAAFFPDVPSDQAETYDYPRPHSREFWHLYGEPVHWFVRGVVELKSAVDALVNKPIADPADSEFLKLWESVLRFESLNSLNESAYRTYFQDDNGTVRMRWGSPSLIGMYAAMVAEDLNQGRRALQCANPRCGKAFLAGAWQTTYCDDKCRRYVKQVEYRNRKKGKAADGSRKE